MKCKLCNEKNGSTRCEGCDTLFCLQCINKHHGELIQEFQQLMDIRNDLKESLNLAETTSENENKLPCFLEIDRWEQGAIECIREVARKVRLDINEIKAKRMGNIDYELEQISVNMQQQEKEGNYLENDIEKIKLQLNILKENIQQANKNIQVIISDNINWDKLIHVVTDENLAKDFRKSFERPINQSKQSNTQQTSFRPTVHLPFQSDNSKSFRPISPPVVIPEDSSDIDRNSSSSQEIILLNRATLIQPTDERLTRWDRIFKNT